MRSLFHFFLGAAFASTCFFSYRELAARHRVTPLDPRIPVPERFLSVHQAILEQERRGPVGVLFLGDSITNCWQTVPWIWQESFARFNPCNAGVGFDQIQNVRWRVDNGVLDGIHPRVIVLLIGINNFVAGNNSPRMAATGVQDLIGHIRSKQPRARILLLGLFPCPALARQVAETNTLLKTLEDGQNVFYLDVGSQIPPKDFPDGVHPNPSGYREWAGRMLPTLSKIYDEAPSPDAGSAFTSVR